MKDDRLRVPIDDEYLRAVGLALFGFARLEWSAVYCCEKINSGYLNNVALKTAGQIAIDLIANAKNHPDVAIQLSLGAASTNFQSLVKQRNDLVHANPGTALWQAETVSPWGAMDGRFDK